MVQAIKQLMKESIKHEGFKKAWGALNEMDSVWKHRFLRRFAVQDRGASNRVTHENKTVLH